ncbi:MAG: hypothetical protein M1828_003572 [Chrysothrix sp. TS-e1954]|nr:MAG: hypothetical protein M1828_003572 [Chrysothrix sp. TS-e1954]
MAALQHGFVDPAVFESLQAKIDDDTKVKDEIRDVCHNLDKQVKLTYAVSPAVEQVSTAIVPAIQSQISALVAVAYQHPFYKFNQMWTRHMQDAAFAVVLCGWLGGFGRGREGGLLTIDDVGHVLKVPVNIKERDAFHLTIEEYLHALISLIDELARFARNSVTLGNYQRPLVISQFIKDLHAGFQILNLKNDSLRRRVDSIKYKVREVEDVIYDLSLRGLLVEKPALAGAS